MALQLNDEKHTHWWCSGTPKYRMFKCQHIFVKCTFQFPCHRICIFNDWFASITWHSSLLHAGKQFYSLNVHLSGWKSWQGLKSEIFFIIYRAPVEILFSRGQYICITDNCLNCWNNPKVVRKVIERTRQNI